MPALQLHLTPPSHLIEFNDTLSGKCLTEAVLMRELVDFGLRHIQQPGCGPFVAAIQAIESGEILVVGANLVLHWKQSWAHAERVALAFAQEKLNTHALPYGKYRLVSTSQLCIACYGEALCSGLTEIVTGTTAEDVESLTLLCEGVLPKQWQEQLRERGIALRPEVERNYAQTLLRAYGTEGARYFDAGSAKKN